MTTTPRTPKSQTPTRPIRPPTEYAFPSPPKYVFPSPATPVKERSPAPPMKLFDTKRAASTPPETTDENRLRSLSRGTPGDLPSVSHLEQSWHQQQLSKKKSQYYGDVFAYREPNNTARDRVTKDSMVMADIKLNCILESEHSFISDLAFQLSEIYQRPESCIMVTISPRTPMLLGGTSQPAYLMKISALPSEIAPTKNKRSTALMQDFMLECLDIAPQRGIVCFEAIAEENLATNGMTTLQEIEAMERHLNESNEILRTISRNRSRKGKKGFAAVFAERGKTPTPSSRTITPSHLKYSSGETADSKSTDASGPERKRVKRRKSIMAFFGRGHPGDQMAIAT